MGAIPDLVCLQCPVCGVGYAIPAELHAANCDGRSKDGWYCPNGHCLTITETDANKLRRERDRLQQRLAQRDDEIAAEQKRTAAYKGQVTRLKKRAAAGLCPCCNRHFTNLKRHMATKHAGMDPDEPLKVIEGGKP